MNNYYIGIDIGGTNIRVALIDSELQIVRIERCSTKIIENKKMFLNLLSELVYKVNYDKLANKIAIVFPSPYCKKIDSIIDITNIPCIEGCKFYEIREVFNDYDVIFENDVNVVAMLECDKGAGKNSECMIYITISTGIGSGIIVDGKILNGANGYAGEIGTVIINSKSNEWSECTLENLCSGNAIEKIMTERCGKKTTAKDFFELYKIKDEIALNFFDEWIDNIGTGFASTIQMFDPEIIVVGGAVSLHNDWIIPKIKENIKTKVMGQLSSKINIKLSEFGEDAGLIGAGYLIITENKK